MRTRRRFEPWPWALAIALGLMICTSLGFYAIAVSHPDPVVIENPRPGMGR